MAKNGIPLKTGGSGLLSKVIGWLVVIAVLTLVVKYPADTAGWVRELAGLASDAVDGISTFLRTLIA